jgi:hypothetical protein
MDTYEAGFLTSDTIKFQVSGGGTFIVPLLEVAPEKDLPSDACGVAKQATNLTGAHPET